MRWPLPALLSSLLLSVALSGSARACINDREVGNAEREFKSSYNYKTAPSPSPIPDTSETSTAGRLIVYGGMSTGILLLLGAGLLCLTKTRKP